MAEWLGSYKKLISLLRIRNCNYYHQRAEWVEFKPHPTQCVGHFEVVGSI